MNVCIGPVLGHILSGLLWNVRIEERLHHSLLNPLSYSFLCCLPNSLRYLFNTIEIIISDH